MASATIIEIPRSDAKVPGNLDNVIKWKTADDVGMLRDFINHAPMRSVIINFSPEAAERVLELANQRNRKIAVGNRSRVEQSLKSETFQLTGDTIKFGKSGALLDGQHRLEAAVRANHDLTSHVVFGLDDGIFSVLDQGRKRTPGDVLHIADVKYPTLVAGAIRWAKAFEEETTPQHMYLPANEILRLAERRYKGIDKWVNSGQYINKAYHHSPAMITALLFTIARHDPELAERFAHDWIHAPQIGRAENFAILQKRLINLGHETGGRVNHYVRAAMIVNMFNAWHANVKFSSPSDPALIWKLGWRFPKIHFDPKAYRAEVEARTRFAEMTQNQRLVYVALETGREGTSRRVSKSINELSELTDIRPNTVAGILKQLVERGHIALISEGETHEDASTYQIQKDLDVE